MPNIVDTKAISELRDRRVFYIPAYQRGYRWNKSQVDKLLDDLYAFCKKRDKADGEFYCLQPVIVKRLTDPVIREKMQMAPEETVYEVIDGQQRLTTLYLLLRYVIQNSMLRTARKDEYLQKLFSLVYQTRENMWPYLRNIEGQDTFSNIDEKHARNAWEWIETWFDCNSTDDVTPEDMIYDFEKLLRQSKSTTEACGSVQVIWYEISEDQNVIREFLSTNNGKIKLTDAELIKALFLQKRNYVNDDGNRKQLEKALEWERIENTLHQDDFWYFLYKKRASPANRIELVLRLAANDIPSIAHDQENALFNYYNNLFDGLDGIKLEDTLNQQWRNIMDCFRTLEDWYLDPVRYNLVGFLTQAGTPMESIYSEYLSIKEDTATQSIFADKLKGLVRNVMKGFKVEDAGYNLNKTYKHDSADIKKALLLFNIHTLNSQLEQLNSKAAKNGTESKLNSPSYKFPFDVYVTQKWDVEHIDSQKAIDIKGFDNKRAWVDTYMVWPDSGADTPDFVTAYESRNWDKCIEIIQKGFGEGDEDLRDEIGNLTLLDDETNRSYGNAIFPDKQQRIIDEIRQGKYVPPCTQLVFFKTFGSEHRTTTVWDSECKKAYGKYICDQLKNYLTDND